MKLINLCAKFSIPTGFPQPRVTWWQGKELVDNTSHVVPGNSTSARRDLRLHEVVNILTLGPLTADLVREPFTCRSKNNPLSKERFDSVLLKIYSKCLLYSLCLHWLIYSTFCENKIFII